MKDIIACPRCGRKLELPDGGVGRTVQCPACGETFEGRPQHAVPPPPSKPIVPALHPASPPRSWSADLPPLARTGVKPHRGGMILTFGMLSLLPCLIVTLIFGLIAWTMGNADLQEMKTGTMNPAGESATYTGRAIGIVGVVMWSIIHFFICLAFMR